MTSTNALVIIFSLQFVVGMNAIFYVARWTTNVNDKEIQVTFWPFFSKPKTILWNEIEKAYVRKYHAIWEYSGWGFRFGWKGRYYNTSWNQGLQLVLKSGKKILVGRHKS